MTISLSCSCGRKLQVREEFAGQTGQCPACGNTLAIPYPAGPGAIALSTQAASQNGPEPRAREEPPPALPLQDDEPLRNHGGDLVPDTADFFAPAPAEIGQVISASTTLRREQQPVALGVRLMGGLLAAGVGVFVGVLIVAGASVRNEFWLVFWPGVLALVGFCIVMAATGFSHTCTYVGREGVARFVCTGTRDNLTTQEVFKFRDATDLRTSTTLRYVNGAYQGTNYSYVWTDIGGRQRYTIGGSHNSEANTPVSTDLYHFALGAEMAWTIYLLESVSRPIDLGSPVLFNLTGGQWIRLGPGVITFGLSAQPEEWQATEIRSASLQQGVVRILRHDAKEGWFSSRGVCKFNYDQLSNAKLFFYLLDKVVGVPLS